MLPYRGSEGPGYPVATGRLVVPPVPKPAAQRQRRNLRSTARVIETTEDVERPSLPDEYHDLTKSWWKVIWHSPISDEWVDADVPGLVALAQLVEDFWRADPRDRTKAHAEVRMASREYGLSPMSRRSLQWEVRRIEGAPKPKPVNARRRGGKAVLSALTGGKASA